MIRRILLTAVMPFLTVCFISAQTQDSSFANFEKEQTYKYEEYKNFIECQKEYFAYLRGESLEELSTFSIVLKKRSFEAGDIRNVGAPIPVSVINLFYGCLVCEPIACIEDANLRMQNLVDNMEPIYIEK